MSTCSTCVSWAGPWAEPHARCFAFGLNDEMVVSDNKRIYTRAEFGCNQWTLKGVAPGRVRVSLNGEMHDLPTGELSYERIVELSGGHVGVIYTVAYSGVGPMGQVQGTLTPGYSIWALPGMRIDCVHTGNA